MPKRTTQAELDRRRSEALAMKVAGHTLRQIGEHLFVSHETARKDIQHALDKARGDSDIANEQFKVLTLSRLNELFRLAWPISLSGTPEADAAFDQVMRIMELELQIRGLLPYVQEGKDAP